MKKFVICGNSNEYFDYLLRSKKSPQEYIYLHDITQLHGYSEVHGVFCGTYREREDINEVVHAIKRINRLPSFSQLIPPSEYRPRPRLKHERQYPNS
jgi:2-iminoacetate synthase ThiH